MRRILFFLLSLVTTFTSCHFDAIRGDGNMKTQSRSVGSFNSVDAGGNFEVHITQGPAADVRIETDENLMEFIEIRTNGDELEINTRDHYNLDPTNKIKVFVSAPMFKRLRASGASRIYGENKLSSSSGLDIGLSGASNAKLELDAPSVDIDLSGASGIQLTGQTKKLDIGGSGASNIHCFDLMAEDTRLDLSGASEAEVFASVTLKVEASGASHIRYKGNPSVNQNVSGAGSVSKAD